MDNVFVQLLIVALIGASLVTVSRVSRNSHEKEYGKSSAREKLRFAAVFLCTLLLMVAIAIKWPLASIFSAATVIFSGFVVNMGTKPSLYKDVMYSATISAFISLFTVWAVHGM